MPKFFTKKKNSNKENMEKLILETCSFEIRTRNLIDIFYINSQQYIVCLNENNAITVNDTVINFNETENSNWKEVKLFQFGNKTYLTALKNSEIFLFLHENHDQWVMLNNEKLNFPVEKIQMFHYQNDNRADIFYCYRNQYTQLRISETSDILIFKGKVPEISSIKPQKIVDIIYNISKEGFDFVVNITDAFFGLNGIYEEYNKLVLVSQGDQPSLITSIPLHNKGEMVLTENHEFYMFLFDQCELRIHSRKVGTDEIMKKQNKTIPCQEFKVLKDKDNVFLVLLDQGKINIYHLNSASKLSFINTIELEQPVDCLKTTTNGDIIFRNNENRAIYYLIKDPINILKENIDSEKKNTLGKIFS